MIGAHIERYLCGRTEFESNINPITVDVRSSSLLLPPPPPPSSPPTSRANPARSPSPLLRDVGPANNTPASTERTRPSPFRRAVGGLILARRRNWRGRTQEVGGRRRESTMRGRRGEWRRGSRTTTTTTNRNHHPTSANRATNNPGYDLNDDDEKQQRPTATTTTSRNHHHHLNPMPANRATQRRGGE